MNEVDYEINYVMTVVYITRDGSAGSPWLSLISARSHRSLEIPRALSRDNVLGNVTGFSAAIPPSAHLPPGRPSWFHVSAAPLQAHS